MNRKEIEKPKAPTKFVGLHAHTMFSTYDGLGYPDEHFKYCIENGLNAHAITEHGHMNSYAHAALWIENWNKSNTTFKFIPGVEAYFHPDLEQWARDKEIADQAKLDKKLERKLKDKLQKQSEIVTVVDSDDEIVDIEMSNSLTIENEDETRAVKHYNPVNRRHHLVMLPKNQDGLRSIFKAVSYGYLHGFYRFPRIDSRVLREAAKDGNIIVSHACLGGLGAFNVFQVLQDVAFDDLNQSLLDDPVLMDRCVTAIGNCYDLMTQCVGEENYYLELQFNKLPAQNLVNRAMLEFARRSGVQDKLIVTADSHYPRPELWRERELYKRLGYLNYNAYSPDSIPKSKDDIKCELYPKNAQQVWDEYLIQKENTSFYDDDIVKQAIERTHDIAHHVIGEVSPDRSPKFPNLTPSDLTPFKHLVQLCKEGLKNRGLSDNLEYIERLKEELLVIKQMKNAEYFITYKKIIELARQVALVGPGRGSGCGSLVNYVLYITDLDPIKWDLPFARFLSVYRKGAPDIDSDVSDRDKVLDELRKFFGVDNVVPISNYNTFSLRVLVKDLSKFYGIPFDEVNAATRNVEQDIRKATTKHGDDKNLFVLKYDDAIGYICAVNKHEVCDGCSSKCINPASPTFKSFIDAHPEIGESIRVLFKQNRSLGRHAGGVLICDDLPSKMPLITSKGEPQSPWVEGVNHKHLEKVGNYIKNDILGLETLRLIERTIQLKLQKERRKRGWFVFELDDGTIIKKFGDELVSTQRGYIPARDVRNEDIINT